MTSVAPVGQAQACPPSSDTPSGPARFDLAIYEGDSGGWQFVLWADTAKTTPVDLTGASVLAQIRDTPGGTILLALTCTIMLPNVVGVSLAATDSETLTAGGVWDLQVTSLDGWVTTFVAGRALVTPDVTR